MFTNIAFYIGLAVCYLTIALVFIMLIRIAILDSRDKARIERLRNDQPA